MNSYQQAMNHFPLPDDLEARLREQVLTHETAQKKRVFKPRIRRRMGLIGVAAAMFLTTGAAFVLPWDPFLHHRYGIFNILAENAFQKVNVTAVCDDVTVTVREVIGDSSSISYILDYQLPKNTPQEVLEEVEKHGGAYPKDMFYLLHGNVTWEDYRNSDGEKWKAVDWGDFESSIDYWRSEDNLLYDYEEIARDAGSSGTQRYDPETRTITYLWRYSIGSPDVNFTTQPLTIAMTPPVVDEGGQSIALSDHPVLVTFQPDYQTTEKAGTLQDGDVTIHVKVNSMFVSIDSCGIEYASMEDAARDTKVIYKDGREMSLSWVASVGGGGGIAREDGTFVELSFSAEWMLLTDTSQITAIQMGDYLIPLENAEPTEESGGN